MAGSGSMMEHGDVAWGAAVTPADESCSSAQPGGGEETLTMFLSEVQGPESQEHFGELFAEVVFPQLSNLEVIAGAWAERGPRTATSSTAGRRETR